MKRFKSSERGYTLLECMVTLGILTLIAVVGVSGYAQTSGWLARIRLKAAARDMVMNLQFAKMEAIKRNTYCTIAFSQPVGGTTYFYAIFPDPNQNLVYNPGPGPGTDPAPLKTISLANYQNVSLDTTQGGGNGLTFSLNTAGIRAFCFDQKGIPRVSAPPAIPPNPAQIGGGTVFLQDGLGNKMSIVINTVGQIRLIQ